VAKTKELKKRYGAEEGRIITSVLERAVSRERLFLFSASFHELKTSSETTVVLSGRISERSPIGRITSTACTGSFTPMGLLRVGGVSVPWVFQQRAR